MVAVVSDFHVKHNTSTAPYTMRRHRIIRPLQCTLVWSSRGWLIIYRRRVWSVLSQQWVSQSKHQPSRQYLMTINLHLRAITCNWIGNLLPNTIRRQLISNSTRITRSESPENCAQVSLTATMMSALPEKQIRSHQSNANWWKNTTYRVMNLGRC